MRAQNGQAISGLARPSGRAGRWCVMGMLTLLLALGAGAVQAQQEEFVEAPPPGEELPEGAPAGVGGEFTRLEVLQISQMSYKRHPFLQITGDSDFQDGKAADGGSVIETPPTASGENILLKGIHSLPPFSIETGTGTDLPFPRAVSVGFDYTRISQLDKDALNTDKAVVTIPRIQMDTYYYVGFIRAYAFDASEPGINYYLGLGIGILEGAFNAVPFLGASQETVSFNQTPIGVQQLGIEMMGDNFGFRYEVRLLNARKVQLDKNPYLGQQNETEINFSGTMTRLSLLYQF